VLSGLHFLTHIGLSWIIANLTAGSRKDRVLIVLAGLLPDLDGVGILWSEPVYLAAHRAAGHSLLFAVLLVILIWRTSDAAVRTTVLGLISFHVHLVLDVVGTGGLPIRYLWPMSNAEWTWSGRWTLASWPNVAVMALTALGVLWVARRSGRSLFATFWVPWRRPVLDRALPILGGVLLVAAAAVVLDGRVAAGVAVWKHAILDSVVGTLNPIGSGVTLLVVCTGVGVVGRAQRRSTLHEAAWLGALAFMAAGLVEFAIKHLVGRSRPDSVLDVDSFPSGHATSVFAVATIFAAFYPRLRWPVYALAAAVAAGRVYLERHYVSDVLAGAIIGIVIASLLLGRRHALARWTCLPLSASALQHTTTAVGAVEPAPEDSSRS
jgi:membrane-associated phospholipid phosphatase